MRGNSASFLEFVESFGAGKASRLSRMPGPSAMLERRDVSNADEMKKTVQMQFLGLAHSFHCCSPERGASP
jgi:hypothetical protein